MTKPLNKAVSFKSEKPNQIFIISPEDEDNSSAKWYSEEDLKEARRHVELAGLAVNDACGDFDVTNDVETHRRTVLERQNAVSPDELARISQELSLSSLELGRLYGLVLERDVRDDAPVNYETLLEIVNRVLIDCDEDDGNNDDASIETIDDFTWEEPVNDPLESTCEEPKIPVESDTHELDRVKCSSSSLSACEIYGNKQVCQTADYEKKSFSKDIAPIVTKFADPEPRLETKKRAVDVVEFDTSCCQLEHSQKRQKVAFVEQDTQDRCNVAHALISLARWEFRSNKIFT